MVAHTTLMRVSVHMKIVCKHHMVSAARRQRLEVKICIVQHGVCLNFSPLHIARFLALSLYKTRLSNSKSKLAARKSKCSHEWILYVWRCELCIGVTCNAVLLLLEESHFIFPVN